MNGFLRRQKIIEYLCECRHENIANLMFKFHVSRSTIIRDIQALAEKHPIYTSTGIHGGINIVDGYYLSKSYLPEKHIVTFEKMKQRLHGEELEAVEYILKKYKKPERRRI